MGDELIKSLVACLSGIISYCIRKLGLSSSISYSYAVRKDLYFLNCQKWFGKTFPYGGGVFDLRNIV
ncbi:hypothetical protein SAMN05216231_2735 [Virgibacillus salinus]|uniref:Uncharacterized protein n=1 Tax=Virgibacillus salinus TaxID=553311 RepID=A0A1H1E692_9BACI|nr:hypothetical protein SAMN05216231_2735 [Virgibacillus salinus]